jgi:putative Holliday junction resolvase
MGIDMGTKRIGIAMSDANGMVAFPREVLDVTEQTFEIISSLLRDEGVQRVVIGASTARSGLKNPIASHAEKYADSIRHAFPDVEIIFEWEGYTSAHARTIHAFHEGKARGVIARKLKKELLQRVDATAAALILQSYLDKHSRAARS